MRTLRRAPALELVASRGRELFEQSFDERSFFEIAAALELGRVTHLCVEGIATDGARLGAKRRRPSRDGGGARARERRGGLREGGVVRLEQIDVDDRRFQHAIAALERFLEATRHLRESGQDRVGKPIEATSSLLGPTAN